MATAWFIVPYKRRDHPVLVRRYCEIDDYSAQIQAWKEIEILGDRAIVKVIASQSVLDNLAGVYKRLPKSALDDSLSDLSAPIKNALKNEILDQGYTLQEVQARFGNDLGQYALRDVLKFMASRRHRPRYDSQADEIILDGDVVFLSPSVVDDVDDLV